MAEYLLLAFRWTSLVSKAVALFLILVGQGICIETQIKRERSNIIDPDEREDKDESKYRTLDTTCYSGAFTPAWTWAQSPVTNYPEPISRKSGVDIVGFQLAVIAFTSLFIGIDILMLILVRNEEVHMLIERLNTKKYPDAFSTGSQCCQAVVMLFHVNSYIVLFGLELFLGFGAFEHLNKTPKGHKVVTNQSWIAAGALFMIAVIPGFFNTPILLISRHWSRYSRAGNFIPLPSRLDKASKLEQIVHPMIPPLEPRLDPFHETWDYGPRDDNADSCYKQENRAKQPLFGQFSLNSQQKPCSAWMMKEDYVAECSCEPNVPYPNLPNKENKGGQENAPEFFFFAAV